MKRCGSIQTMVLMTGWMLMNSLPGQSPLQAQDPKEEPAVAKTVVFLGDSITQAGAAPGGYVTLLNESLQEHYPAAGYHLVGAGISGNRVPDIQARLDADVLSKKPDLVVIYIGINDVWHSQSGRGTSEADYEAGLVDVIGRIRATGSQVLLCTPSMIGEKTDGSNPLDEMLETYSAISRKVAREMGVTLFDLRKTFVRDLKIRNPEGKESGVLTTDGVHLNPAGNQFLSECLRPWIHSVATGNCVRHIVLFKFKETATAADINHIADEFAQLKDKIEFMQDFESGADISPETLNQGYTHAFVATFADEASRDAYLVHPAHKDFVGILSPHLEGALVIDFLGTSR